MLYGKVLNANFNPEAVLRIRVILMRTGPGPNFHFEANPDPGPHQGDVNLPPTSIQTLHGSIF
jgi:hypothetical protein